MGGRGMGGPGMGGPGMVDVHACGSWLHGCNTSHGCMAAIRRMHNAAAASECTEPCVLHACMWGCKVRPDPCHHHTSLPMSPQPLAMAALHAGCPACWIMAPPYPPWPPMPTPGPTMLPCPWSWRARARPFGAGRGRGSDSQSVAATPAQGGMQMCGRGHLHRGASGCAAEAMPGPRTHPVVRAPLGLGRCAWHRAWQ